MRDARWIIRERVRKREHEGDNMYENIREDERDPCMRGMLVREGCLYECVRGNLRACERRSEITRKNTREHGGKSYENMKEHTHTEYVRSRKRTWEKSYESMTECTQKG